MKGWACGALGPVASVHLLSLQHSNYYSIRPVSKRKCTLLASRQRRMSNDGSTLPTLQLMEEDRLLIDKEEAARLKRVGQEKRRHEKRARLENRVTYLQNLPGVLTEDQQKELKGLLRVRDSFEEQYDPNSFSEEHKQFKWMHNEAFVALARYCQKNRGDGGEPNVFYLDGPDMGTTICFEKNRFDLSTCYVANRHLSTCKILREKLADKNVICCTAAEALTPHHDIMADDDKDGCHNFSNVDFTAYYFDGCGGFVPHIIGMITAALIRSSPAKTTAVGFSLMGGNRDVVEKELMICQTLASIARTRNMQTRHVLDEPGRYGVPLKISKTEGGTFTSWIILESETR